jgi:hypothetical protein
MNRKDARERKDRRRKTSDSSPIFALLGAFAVAL